ncbi:MAG: exosortase C-terminal domain/associated protein EpsI [Candidatus Thiodiazotropha sp.]
MNTLISNKYLITILGFALIILVYLSTASGLLYTLWNDPSPYAHGSAILIITLALISKTFYSNKKHITINFNTIGLLLLFLSSIGWFISSIVYIEILQQLFLILVFISFLIAIYGHRYARLFYIPLGLLILGLPIWDIFVPYFQDATTVTTLLLLQVTNIPSYSEGMYISIPEGTFKIATLCSGMRYQAASLIILAIYAYIYSLSVKRMIFYAILISFFAFVTNQLRVFIVIVSGHLTDMQHYFVREDHVSLGWVLFAIMMIIFFQIVSRIDARSDNAETGSRLTSNEISKGNVYTNASLFLLVLLAVVSGPMLNYKYDTPSGSLTKSQKLHLETLNDFRLTESGLHEKLPVWTDGHTVCTGQYSNSDSKNIDLYVSHFSYQNEDLEAISINHRYYNPYEWERIDSSTRNITLNSGLNINAIETILSQNLRLKNKQFDTAKKRVIWSWYHIGNSTQSNVYIAKLRNLYETIMGNPAISIYIISTDLIDDAEKARQTLLDFSESALKIVIDHCESDL